MSLIWKNEKQPFETKKNNFHFPEGKKDKKMRADTFYVYVCPHLIDVTSLVVQHSEKSLQPLYVVSMGIDELPVLLDLVLRIRLPTRLLLLGRAQTVDLGLKLVDLDVERAQARVDPVLDLAALFLRRVHLGRPNQPLLGVGLRFRFSLNHLESLHLLWEKDKKNNRIIIEIDRSIILSSLRREKS